MPCLFSSFLLNVDSTIVYLVSGMFTFPFTFIYVLGRFYYSDFIHNNYKVVVSCDIDWGCIGTVLGLDWGCIGAVLVL